LTKPLNLHERSVDSMQSHWRSINAACTKFNGAYIQVTRQKKSGWTEEKYLEEVYKIYEEEEKEKFSYYECWLLLRDHPKWSVGETSIRNIIAADNKKEESEDESVESVVVTNDDNRENKKVAASSKMKNKSSERPNGQKMEKERKKEMSQSEVASMNANSLRIRAAAQQDTVTYNVMKQLGSEHPAAKKWFEMMAERAVNQMKAEMEEEQKRDDAKKKKENAEEESRRKLKEESRRKLDALSKDSVSKESASKTIEVADIIELPPSNVSPATSSITAPSSGSGSSSARPANNFCCAGDYCFVSNGHAKVCGVTCYVCSGYCHFDCVEVDDDGYKKCNLCDKKATTTLAWGRTIILTCQPNFCCCCVVIIVIVIILLLLRSNNSYSHHAVVVA
jgi:hypothetical protein